MSKIFDKKPFYVQMIRVKASSTLFKASRKRQDKTPPTKQTDLDILTGFDWFWRFEKAKSVPRASGRRRGVSSVIPTVKFYGTHSQTDVDRQPNTSTMVSAAIKTANTSHVIMKHPSVRFGRFLLHHTHAWCIRPIATVRDRFVRSIRNNQEPKIELILNS
jgi:hypothetical protein